MDVKRLKLSATPRTDSDSGLTEITRRIVGQRYAPSASITVSRRRSNGWQRISASAGTLRSGAATPNTPYDLASLTKPIVALAAAELADNGVLRLTDPISKWLPELQHTKVATACIEQLLSHRAGLLGHRVLFDQVLQNRAVRRSPMLVSAARSLQVGLGRSGPGCAVSAVYSDLGYLILGAIVERATRIPLDSYVSESILEALCAPIASSRQWVRHRRDFLDIVAPTETVACRGGTLRGVVHDENAWAWAGYGIAGHAGLFGTSPALALVGEAMLDALAGRPSGISRFAALVCTSQREAGSLRAGFDGVSAGRSSAGTRMSRLSFGHLGFTGTSIWCDPENEFVFVVLTNRVHPTRSDTRLPNARAAIHDELFAWANTNGHDT